MKSNIFKIVLISIALAAVLWVWQRSAYIHAPAKEATTTDQQPVERIIHDSIVHNIYRENPVNTELEQRLYTSQGYIDTIKRALKIAQRDLTSVQKTNAELFIENQKMQEVARENAALKSNEIFYKDKYLTLLVNKDSNTFNMNYDVSLNTVTYKKRKNIFSPYQHYVDVFSDDPRVRINGINRFVMQHKERRALLSLNAEAGYNAIIMPGVWQSKLNGGLRLKFNPDGALQPHVGAGYWYNPNTGDYGKYLGAGVDVKIIKF